MSNNQCGCGSSQPSDGNDYMMVRVSKGDPNNCGDPTQTVLDECSKTELTYDILLSDFAIPAAESSINIIVCNGSLYAVGEWLQFLDPVCILQIIAISGNTITLANRCPDNTVVAENPAIGTIVKSQTRFIVATAPLCDDGSLLEEKIEEYLGDATQICVENLSAATSTMHIQPVGRVENDEANPSGFLKCIRRIYGIIFKKGRPFLTAMGDQIAANNAATYRRLAIHKTTGEIRVQKNYSEIPGLNTNRRYFPTIAGGDEDVKHGYLTRIFHWKVEESTTDYNPLTWDTFTTNWDKDFDLSADADIASIIANTELDHFYVMVRLEIAASRSGGTPTTMVAEIKNQFNGVLKAGRVIAATDEDYLVQFNTISLQIKVKKSDPIINLKFITTGTTRFYYKLDIDGAFM